MRAFRAYHPLRFLTPQEDYTPNGVGYIDVRDHGENEVIISIVNARGETIGGSNILTISPTGTVTLHTGINHSIELPSLNRHRAFTVRNNR